MLKLEEENITLRRKLREFEDSFEYYNTVESAKIPENAKNERDGQDMKAGGSAGCMSEYLSHFGIQGTWTRGSRSWRKS